MHGLQNNDYLQTDPYVCSNPHRRHAERNALLRCSGCGCGNGWGVWGWVKVGAHLPLRLLVCERERLLLDRLLGGRALLRNLLRLDCLLRCNLGLAPAVPLSPHPHFPHKTPYKARNRACQNPCTCARRFVVGGWCAPGFFLLLDCFVLFALEPVFDPLLVELGNLLNLQLPYKNEESGS